MSEGSLVPFGKYKDQPIEVLAQDRQYVERLTAQPWFRDKFAGLYTVIINSFQEASETPEHNALQVLFLEDEWCARFFGVLKQDWQPDLVTALRKNVEAERQSVIKGTQQDAKARMRAGVRALCWQHRVGH